MKFYVVALFAFLAVATATETDMTFMNTLKADIAVLMEKGATVESVLKLLDDILGHEENDLKVLIHTWEKVKQPHFLEIIAKAQKAVDDKKEECATIKKFIESQEKEVKQYEENISRAQKKIAANLKAVERREASRCKNNILFLDKVREARQVRHFLVYLVKQMSKKSFANTIKNNAAAFLSLREVALNQHEDSIAELMKIHFMSQFFEEEAHPSKGYTDEQLDKMFNVHKRSDKEIGSGHVDNKKAALKLDTYHYTEESAADYVNGVVKFIRGIISEIDGNIKKLREAEEDAVAHYQAYRQKIEYENISLTIYIKQCKEFIVQLKKDIEANKVVLQKCLEEIPPLEAILHAHQKAYKDAYDAYVARRANLENVVIPTLKLAKKKYIAQVEKVAGKKFSARISDYAADEKFDKTKNFEKRTHFSYKTPVVKI